MGEREREGRGRDRKRETPLSIGKGEVARRVEGEARLEDPGLG